MMLLHFFFTSVFYTGFTYVVTSLLKLTYWLDLEMIAFFCVSFIISATTEAQPLLKLSHKPSQITTSFYFLPKEGLRWSLSCIFYLVLSNIYFIGLNEPWKWIWRFSVCAVGANTKVWFLGLWKHYIVRPVYYCFLIAHIPQQVI